MHVHVGLPADNDRRQLIAAGVQRIGLSTNNADWIYEHTDGVTCSDLVWLFQQIALEMHRAGGAPEATVQRAVMDSAVQLAVGRLQAYGAALSP